jgi:hypothetical protein
VQGRGAIVIEQTGLIERTVTLSDAARRYLRLG